ncbi:MAG: hypothetical protein J07HQX50_02265 [Haloquadratum sp. J07HQX50]|nr:MAG: hypothetical protein J07HQX50_02265 [Haloquadratum sp. J07HQX50]
MRSAETPSAQEGEFLAQANIGCDECREALESAQRESISFFIIDNLTIPMISCDTHGDQFSSICGLTTSDSAERLEYYPAGGISCPGCQLAPYEPGHPVIQIGDGMVAIPACPRHQSEIISRYQAGLETQQKLTSSIDGSDPNSLLHDSIR